MSSAGDQAIITKHSPSGETCQVQTVTRRMVVNKKMRNKVRSLSFRAAGRGRALAALGRQRRSLNSLSILSQSCQLLQLSCGPELEDMPQNLRSGERGDATAAYNRGPGVLGSGRGKRQHGLVGATIKARCQLLEKEKTHLLSSICKSTKNRAGCLWPDG